MFITYQNEYQVVSASNLKTQKQQSVVNRVIRPDDGYAQDNGYFYLAAATLNAVLYLVDCFFSDFSELEDYNPDEDENFIPDADRFDYLAVDEQDNDFDEWLASNYSPAGEDASNGEQWFLSNSPHEFMPIPISKLREQWERNSLPEGNNRYRFVIDTETRTEDEEKEEPDNVTTFQIPEHYLSLIFNGDASGYEEEEIKAWEEFEQGMLANGFTNGHWSYPDNQEAYFSHSNDVHNLGDNVVDLQWVDMSN